ncbi:MAG: RIP metalloprotease RseP [Bacteroidetes bacterium HGW-Bacteroidetes-21]|jgi:regulator of sigma E protease|nr:MAG: RIP metalloprotease RseP [Bacteroidetes bacterium HGW-Bacteroidetes-21]
MEIVVKASQLILSLSILVLLHEMGHFLFARLFKTRVEKFYLFFNPWFSLFKKKIGDTEYGIGWLPLGGYVKISGMIDESMDKEQMKQPAQPHEFRSKKSWQRLLIMMGGIIMNVITAFVIYSMVLFTWGEKYLANENAIYGVMVDSTGTKMGLQNGDMILEVDGSTIENFKMITHDVIVNKAKTIKLLRNGEEVTVNIPSTVWPELIKNPNFVQPRLPFLIASFPKESYGKDAGFMVGDRVIAMNNTRAEYYDEVKDNLTKYKGTTVVFDILRNKDTVQISTKIPESGLLELFLEVNPDSFFVMNEKSFGFFESFPAGVEKTFSTLNSYIKQFKLLFSSETKAYESLGGFISIGKIFPGVWDWYAFWAMTAFLSVILAFMNFLPIPALDGGHVFFLLYEMITGRKPGDKFMEYAQMTGMFLLIALLLFANGNDIVKLFK